MPTGKYLLHNATRVGVDLSNGCSYGIHLRAEQASCHIAVHTVYCIAVHTVYDNISACNMLTSARQDLGGGLL